MSAVLFSDKFNQHHRGGGGGGGGEEVAVSNKARNRIARAEAINAKEEHPKHLVITTCSSWE